MSDRQDDTKTGKKKHSRVEQSRVEQSRAEQMTLTEQKPGLVILNALIKYNYISRAHTKTCNKAAHTHVIYYREWKCSVPLFHR